MTTRKQKLEDRTQKLWSDLEKLRQKVNSTAWYKDAHKDQIKSFKYNQGLNDQKSRVVRSLTISTKNDDFITTIQQRAKEQDTFISKDVIVNIAIDRLAKGLDEEGYEDFHTWISRYLLRY